MLTLAWPWMLLALPLPWLAGLALPPARRQPAQALWLPFYQQIPRVLRYSLEQPGGHRATPGHLVAWLLLLLAASRPQRLTGDGSALELYDWPLALALLVSLVVAWRGTRSARPYRRLGTGTWEREDGDDGARY